MTSERRLPEFFAAGIAAFTPARTAAAAERQRRGASDGWRTAARHGTTPHGGATVRMRRVRSKRGASANIRFCGCTHRSTFGRRPSVSISWPGTVWDIRWPGRYPFSTSRLQAIVCTVPGYKNTADLPVYHVLLIIILYLYLFCIIQVCIFPQPQEDWRLINGLLTNYHASRHGLRHTGRRRRRASPWRLRC